ncbi:tripartite tricarboxylate transporter permease [Aliiruegeria lutimaris]|uniref:TctA family transporter n=1 Tax=Aliiruegeria lutimaris TaxID=571298 RepID=A0A1G9AH73_9RHOB|nr:tripartite tricarboxylate transporter permease [Aliiruegeria lutimaris]SDK25855.1 TctA family transporter [Aliiruegeria lutimaris]
MEFLDIPYMLDSAWTALGIVLDPSRLVFLWFGVIVGLLIGLLPGIGGLTGFAILVPFTYTMDPYAAFAMLLGMHSVTTTSDTIPAVLFGVPGTAASQATILDGHAMAKNGEAGRALSAAFTASLLGGLMGALLLGLTIPVVRPFVLAFGTPELLCIMIFGIAMVAALSGSAPLRGITAACFGVLVSMIGTDSQTGELRWTFGQLYLWDGVPMLPVLLGVFALPELCDLAIKRASITDDVKFSAREGMLQGVKDTFRNWFLVIRCSMLGSMLGLVPGITGSVIDWFAYGHAIRTEKGASETFGTGDVRGVIAPESSNNAKEGGSLVTMIAFGVPHGAAFAILMGALMIHGFIPGPDMLARNLDVTYSMVWSIAVANILGAGICFLLSGQFAKISMLRYTLVLPLIMVIIYVGAYQGSRSWGDLLVLLFFGVLGWVMKRLKWPRPPLILGLILGVMIERYMAISVMRYDAAWLLRPGVIVLLSLSLLTIARPFIRELRSQGVKTVLPQGMPRFHASDILYIVFIVIGAYMLIAAQGWPLAARIGPTAVASTLLVAASISLMSSIFSGEQAKEGGNVQNGGMHMDLVSNDEHLTQKTILLRAAMFFGWFLAFLLLLSIIGLLPTIPVIIIAYMRLEGRESWLLSTVYALAVLALIYGVFDHVLHVDWPRPIIGEMLFGK